MKTIHLLALLLCTFSASAVYVNHQGLGEVLLVPYYTVNNDLNTLVSVTNPTDASKAIKINVREGLNGHAVLSYNVYLSAYDTWTFVFVADTSSFAPFVGQDSVKQYSNDTSCAPFLQKNGQEFLPFELTDGPQDMSRSREGYIEILEMGELQGDFLAAVDQGNIGVPSNCGELEAAWLQNGAWDEASGGNVNQDLVAGDGGLMVEADIINVLEGINYSIPVIAFDDFFAADTINHVDVGDTTLSLDDAEPLAKMFANNEIYELAFDTGVDAVSAVLMADELIGTYVLDSIVAGESETVLSMPTRRFYFEAGSSEMMPPFSTNSLTNQCSDSSYGGTEFDLIVWDRESQREVGFFNKGGNKLSPRPPDGARPAICGSVFISSVRLPGSAIEPPSITGSGNYLTLTSPQNGVTENGFISTRFFDTRPLIGTDVNNNEALQLMGIPIIGITFQKFFNAGAEEGLLAQYGGAHKVKSKVRVIK